MHGYVRTYLMKLFQLGMVMDVMRPLIRSGKLVRDKAWCIIHECEAQFRSDTSQSYIYMYICIDIYTSVDMCISMHRALWIRSCSDLAVMLSVGGLSCVLSCALSFSEGCLGG